MAHIVVTFDDIERMFRPSFNGRRITRVKKHPWMARSLMVEFPGDPEEQPILLTDEIIDGSTVPSIAELIKTTEERLDGKR